MLRMPSKADLKFEWTREALIQYYYHRHNKIGTTRKHYHLMHSNMKQLLKGTYDNINRSAP